MTAPTPATILAQLAATRERDQARRLAGLLVRWGLLVGAPAAALGLVVAAAVAK